MTYSEGKAKSSAGMRGLVEVNYTKSELQSNRPKTSSRSLLESALVEFSSCAPSAPLSTYGSKLIRPCAFTRWFAMVRRSVPTRSQDFGLIPV